MRWWVVALLWGCADEEASRRDAGGLTPREARTPVVADLGEEDTESPEAAARDGAADAVLDRGLADAAFDGGLVDAVLDAAPDAGPDAMPDAMVDPCAQAIDLNAEMAARGFYDGNTRMAPARTLGTCGGGAGGEVLFRYVVAPGEVEVVFATDHPQTTAPTVLYLRAACGDAADLACVRGNDAAPGTRLVFHPPGPGTWFLVVDTGSRDGGGPFRLTAGPPPPPACTDGQDNDGDGRVDLVDPGCAAPADDSEGDPDPLPTCADGLDNDEDGPIDFPNDPDCLAAGDDGETGECLPEEPCDGRNLGAGFQDNSSTGGPWISWRWQPAAAGVVTRLELFSGEQAGATALSLHTSEANLPGVRLARGAFNQVGANGWQGGELDVPVEVQAGVDYWIVWETVAGAQSPFDVAGEAVDYRGSLDLGRSWNGPFQSPVKFRVFCCLE